MAAASGWGLGTSAQAVAPAPAPNTKPTEERQGNKTLGDTKAGEEARRLLDAPRK